MTTFPTRPTRGRKPAVPFEDALGHLDAFAKAHGHANPARSVVTDDGFALGVWVSRQRTKDSQGTLSQEDFAALSELGVHFPTEKVKGRPTLLEQIGAQVSVEVFTARLAQVDAFIAEHGHARIPLDYLTPDGQALGAWIGTTRHARRNGGVPKDRVKALDARGIEWDPTPGRKDYAATFETRLACLDSYRERFSNTAPTKDYLCKDKGCERRDLGQWVIRTRKKFHGKIPGALTPEQVKALNARGFVWNPARGGAAVVEARKVTTRALEDKRQRDVELHQSA